MHQFHINRICPVIRTYLNNLTRIPREWGCPFPAMSFAAVSTTAIVDHSRIQFRPSLVKVVAFSNSSIKVVLCCLCFLSESTLTECYLRYKVQSKINAMFVP